LRKANAKISIFTAYIRKRNNDKNPINFFNCSSLGIYKKTKVGVIIKTKYMNWVKELNLKPSKSKVYWGTIFAVLGLLLTITACNKENDDNDLEEYPFLNVVNLTNDGNSRSIISIELVGYEFNNLNITEGSSQTFDLDSGMPGGYEDVNINVRLSGPQIVLKNIQVNFNKGDTTTITMKGCISFEGCNGFYLE